MSDQSQGPGWWQASDDRWYPPETHPDYVAAPSPQPPVVPAAGRPNTLLLALVAGAVLIVGLGVGLYLFVRDDNSLSGPRLIHPIEVVSLLNTKGYACSNYEAHETDDVIDYRNGTGTCTRGGDEVTVDTFQDRKHLDAHLNLMRGMGCQIAKSAGIAGEYNLIIGRFYAISLHDQLDEEAARSLAKQIGARVAHDSC